MKLVINLFQLNPTFVHLAVSVCLAVWRCPVPLIQGWGLTPAIESKRQQETKHQKLTLCKPLISLCLTVVRPVRLPTRFTVSVVVLGPCATLVLFT